MAFPPSTAERPTGTTTRHVLKHPLFVAFASAFVTLVVCIAVGLFLYLRGPQWAEPPEDVTISYLYPAQLETGEEFEIQVTIKNLADRSRVVDSIDVYDDFLAGVLIQGSFPPWRGSSRWQGDFVSYEFQIDLAPEGRTVVTFQAKALKPGNFVAEWTVCVDSPYSCAAEVLRAIVSVPDAGQDAPGPIR